MGYIVLAVVCAILSSFAIQWVNSVNSIGLTLSSLHAVVAGVIAAVLAKFMNR